MNILKYFKECHYRSDWKTVWKLFSVLFRWKILAARSILLKKFKRLFWNKWKDNTNYLEWTSKSWNLSIFLYGENARIHEKSSMKLDITIFHLHEDKWLEAVMSYLRCLTRETRLWTMKVLFVSWLNRVNIFIRYFLFYFYVQVHEIHRILLGSLIWNGWWRTLNIETSTFWI